MKKTLVHCLCYTDKEVYAQKTYTILIKGIKKINAKGDIWTQALTLQNLYS